MAYHSVFNDAKVWKPPTLVHLCGFPLLPLRRVSQTRSAALFGGRKPLLVPDLSLEKDVVDEAIQAFRLNVHFRTFDMRGEGDRVLVYLLLWVQECVAVLVGTSAGPGGAGAGSSSRSSIKTASASSTSGACAGAPESTGRDNMVENVRNQLWNLAASCKLTPADASLRPKNAFRRGGATSERDNHNGNTNAPASEQPKHGQRSSEQKNETSASTIAARKWSSGRYRNSGRGRYSCNNGIDWSLAKINPVSKVLELPERAWKNRRLIEKKNPLTANKANNKRTAVKVSSGPTGAARGKSERNIANPPGKGARGAATTSMGNAVDELPGPGPGPRGNSALASNIFIQKNKAQESEAAARSSQIAALLGIYAPEREEDRELETKMLNVYLRQLREEVVARLLPDFFVEDPASRDESGGSAGGVGNYTSTALRKNKWWTQYAKKKFVGLPSLV